MANKNTQTEGTILTSNLKSQIATSRLDKGEIIIYNPDDSIRLGVRMEQETVWLDRAQMSTPPKFYSVDCKKTKPDSLNCFRGYRESTL